MNPGRGHDDLRVGGSTLPGGNPCGSPTSPELDGAHVQRRQLKNATSRQHTAPEDIEGVAA
ncbi:hypothetical protein TrVGV298_009189 [Trichoderma virens]|nr:hypothetical protein TrVGV298_009189 [Trichoderma virens]